MSRTHALFESLDNHSPLKTELLAHAADSLAACEQATTACATGMLAARDVGTLRAAVNTDLDCADVAAATRRILTRGTDADSALLAAQFEACRVACERSNEVCAQHVTHREHCRICAQATEQTAEVCREVLSNLRGETRGEAAPDS